MSIALGIVSVCKACAVPLNYTWTFFFLAWCSVSLLIMLRDLAIQEVEQG